MGARCCMCAWTIAVYRHPIVFHMLLKRSDIVQQHHMFSSGMSPPGFHAIAASGWVLTVDHHRSATTWPQNSYSEKETTHQKKNNQAATPQHCILCVT